MNKIATGAKLRSSIQTIHHPMLRPDLTDDQIDRTIADDADAAPALSDAWLSQANVKTVGKKAISIRLDEDVLEYFKKTGPLYQTKINKILRLYMENNK